ncbi:hypothetical protein FACS189426_06480 [Bacteroidia bacterium]|nr:hypothetical protein FACS189426_06480 [Bacteroidia bacterium]
MDNIVNLVLFDSDAIILNQVIKEWIEITDTIMATEKDKKDIASAKQIKEEIVKQLKINLFKYNNTSRNSKITYKGEIKTIGEWATEKGIDYDVLYHRIKRYGWSIEKSLET